MICGNREESVFYFLHSALKFSYYLEEDGQVAWNDSKAIHLSANLRVPDNHSNAALLVYAQRVPLRIVGWASDAPHMLDRIVDGRWSNMATQSRCWTRATEMWWADSFRRSQWPAIWRKRKLFTAKLFLFALMTLTDWKLKMVTAMNTAPKIIWEKITPSTTRQYFRNILHKCLGLTKTIDTKYKYSIIRLWKFTAIKTLADVFRDVGDCPVDFFEKQTDVRAHWLHVQIWAANDRYLC